MSVSSFKCLLVLVAIVSLVVGIAAAIMLQWYYGIVAYFVTSIVVNGILIFYIGDKVDMT